MRQFARIQKKNAQLIVIVALSLLTASFDSGAASHRDELKAGAEYEKQGQFFRATTAYSMSLRLDPGVVTRAFGAGACTATKADCRNWTRCLEK